MNMPADQHDVIALKRARPGDEDALGYLVDKHAQPLIGKATKKI